MDGLRDFILSKGYDFDATNLNGKFQKCEDQSGHKVWYIGNDKFFTFGDFREPDKKFTKPLVGEGDTAQLNKFIKKIERDKVLKQEITKALVQNLFSDWECLDMGVENADYLLKKQLPRPPGVVVKNSTEDNQKILVVPMRDATGEIWNIQTIYAGGNKTFHKDGKVKGCWYAFGNLGAGAQRILVGEGFATCQAVHLATGLPVVCAFNISNLESAIKHLIDAGMPSSNIMLLADFDGATYIKTGKNPGMLAVQKLTQKYKVGWRAPCELTETRNIDFADLWTRDGGIDEIKRMAFQMKRANELVDQVFQRPPAKGDGAVNENRSQVQSEDLQPDNLDNSVTTEAGPPGVETSETLTPKQDVSYLIKPLLPQTAPGPIGKELLPDKSSRGRVYATLANFEAIMEHAGAVLRYNVIKKDEEWFIPGEEASLDNYKKVLYARILDLCGKVELPIGQIDSFLGYLCDKNQFNPVKLWIESKPWDGQSRLEHLYSTIQVVGETDQTKLELKKLLIRKWMLSAIAAAMRFDGIAAPGFLVLQGPQYIGKTRWFMSLVPRELDLLAEGKMLDPSNKDSVKQLVCYWMAELGELDATFKKSDIAALKAFITKQVDMFRPAYARHELKFPRRTVFFGSVNNPHFLADETGNRRFWVLECEKINHDHGLDMQQIWAELYEAYKAGEVWWLDQSEMTTVNESNKLFEVLDPLQEKLQDQFDWASGLGEWKTASKILMEMGMQNPDRLALSRCSTFVRRLNGDKRRRSNGRNLLFCGPNRAPTAF